MIIMGRGENVSSFYVLFLAESASWIQLMVIYLVFFPKCLDWSNCTDVLSFSAKSFLFVFVQALIASILVLLYLKDLALFMASFCMTEFFLC